jgi:arginyl-tRNA synthetase
MIKNRLRKVVEDALNKAAADGKLGSLTECPVPIVIESPKLASHGDLACGVALKLARETKMAPVKIAEVIAEYIKQQPEAQNGAIKSFAVANPGFINFELGKSWLSDSLFEIHSQGDAYGRQNVGNGQRVLIEYVSANPTGALHIGHGRGAVFGSCLANLFKFSGYQVEEEFLVNDAGKQIEQLGQNAWACYQRKLGRDIEYSEEGYPEDSIADYVDKLIAEHGDALLSASGEEAAKALAVIIREIIRKEHEELLERLGIKFDRWFSEQALRDANKVEDAIEKLKESEFTYESEGALWLKAKELGDERDRVLKKSTGEFTYLAADAAYHLEKFSRGYDLMINVWGADHHGQVPGLKAVVQALGEDPQKLHVVLAQLVNLSRDGQLVRMSKRQGTVVTLGEVMDEVGVDAVRYYLAESNPQNPINFDLELSKKTSRENPAFYVQYAHARCCSIVRKATQPQPDIASGQTRAAHLTESQMEEFKKEFVASPQVFAWGFEPESEKFPYQKTLAMKLAAFPDEVADAAVAWQPGKLARYAYDLSNDFMKFYEECRVITDDLSVTRARLGLIMATRQVLYNALKIIGVSAPERM